MKVAIYSRVMDWNHRMEIQELFDELAKQKITPVIYRPYFDQIAAGIQLSAAMSTFNDESELDKSIEFLISLGGDGTLLDTVTMV
ncbi:MAG TPA: hypothetical protein VK645_09285, partial [Chitinophagaceae bacterium]|nr:hypothetical protein [Chitinophagaceae bacterium]